MTIQGAMQPQSAEAIVEMALEILRGAPTDGGEIYLQDSQETSATVVDQRVESVETKQERGVAVRAFRDGRVGFSFTPDISREGIGRAVDRAVAILPHVDPDEANSVPTLETSAFALKNLEPGLESVTVEEKVDMARRIESCALRFSTRIKRVRESRYGDIQGACWIANTSGVHGG